MVKTQLGRQRLDRIDYQIPDLKPAGLTKPAGFFLCPISEFRLEQKPNLLA
jgi:hypothetical protein